MKNLVNAVAAKFFIRQIGLKMKYFRRLALKKSTYYENLTILSASEKKISIPESNFDEHQIVETKILTFLRFITFFIDFSELV